MLSSCATRRRTTTHVAAAFRVIGAPFSTTTTTTTTTSTTSTTSTTGSWFLNHRGHRLSSLSSSLSLSLPSSWPTCCKSIRLYSSTTPDEAKAASSSSSSSFFSDSISDFQALGIRSPVLLDRLRRTGLLRPTVVQAKAFRQISMGNNNVTVGAETGSGKTLAYLLPLMDDILQQQQQQQQQQQDKVRKYDYARAIILVPNKELVQQVVRMALPLAGGSKALIYGGSTLIDPSMLDKVLIHSSSSSNNNNNNTDQNNNNDNHDETQHPLIRMAIFPGGLKETKDFPPFRAMRSSAGQPAVDLIVATPVTLAPLALSPKNIDLFADVQTLIVDEADMLLDGGYKKALEQVLMGFRRADKLVHRADKLDKNFGVTKTQHVFVAATIPDYGLRSVDAFLRKRFPTSVQVTVEGMHKARHSGLAHTTVWIEQESKKARMEYLVDLLKMPVQQGGLKDEKVMVFLNTVQDVEGAVNALNQVGFKTIPYHAKIPLVERTELLDRFRRYNNNNKIDAATTTTTKPTSSKANDKDDDDTVPIMVCTDLASRGLDVPNVTAIVQLQFAGNVVAHLHRMGRCGRAGNVEGRGFVFYDPHQAPLIELVRAAEQEQQTTSTSSLTLEGPDVEVDTEWNNDDDDEGNDDDDKEKGSVDTWETPGSVNLAFSRRRGFTRHRKKMMRRKQEGAMRDESDD